MSAKQPEDKKESKEAEIDTKKKKDKEADDKKGKKPRKKNENDENAPDSNSRVARTDSQPDIQPKQIEEPKDKLCFLHGQKLIYFCETCEEPICDKCILLGPHNNQLHRINGVNEAFLPRAQALRQVIDTKLSAKRQEVIKQMQRIDNRIEQIKYVKNMIEKDIKAEFAKIIDKLRMAEGAKTAILLHSLAELQKEVDKIDDVSLSVSELTKENSDPNDLLLRMRPISDEIENVLSRPITKEIQVTPELPMDLEEQREKLEKMKIEQEIIDFKDSVITQLLIEKEDKYDKQKAEYKEAMDKFKADTEKRTAAEIDIWAKIAEHCSDLIKDTQLVCFFCGEALDETTVNSNCFMNNRTNLPLSFTGFSEDYPDKANLGKLRHSFGYPLPEAMDISLAKVSGSKAAKLFENRNFKMHYRLQLEIMLSKIKKYYISKADELEKFFKSNDKANKGVVSGITFAYILHEACGVDLKDVEVLHGFLDPTRENLIPYVEMLKLFKDPVYLNDFINKRYPQLNEAELARPPRSKKDQGPLKANLVGAFQSIAEKPTSKFVGSAIPTSGRSVIPTSGTTVSPTKFTTYY